MKNVLILIVWFFTGVSLVLAQADTSEFYIRVYGDTDTEAPSTPTLLTATPVSTTQIDLTWSTSTDNFAVTGYVVYRSSTTIATTTQVSYSDTGLAASTTYSYYIQAFDNSFNYSSTSNTLATTTLSPTPTPEPEPEPDSETSSQGTAARPTIEELIVEEGYSTTSIFVNTVGPTRIELRWGRTGSYELGYIVGSVYKTGHSFLLTDLEPGTVYEYEIVGFSPYGQSRVLGTGFFETINQGILTNEVPNVGRFTAEASGLDVRLNWTLPDIDDLGKVRIVRSHLGFPAHPNDGAVIYQGEGTSVVDTEIFSVYSPVYYTAFVYDKTGRVSSGAVTIVYCIECGGGKVVVVEKSETGTTDKIIETEATSTIDKEKITPETIMPDLADIFLIQSGVEKTLRDNSLSLFINEPFVVSVPVEVVSKNLKTIIVTVIDPTDNRKTYSYLLKINSDRTAYTAYIPAIETLGRSQISIEIYDYRSFVVGTYKAPFSLVEAETDEGWLSKAKDILNDKLSLYIIYFALSVFVLLVFLLLKRR